MRLFNFEIATETYTSDSQSSVNLDQEITNAETHPTNPIVVGSIVMSDDMLGAAGSDEQASFNVAQDSTSLKQTVTPSTPLTFQGLLSARPDNINSHTTDNVKAEIIVLSHADFKG